MAKNGFRYFKMLQDAVFASGGLTISKPYQNCYLRFEPDQLTQRISSLWW